MGYQEYIMTWSSDGRQPESNSPQHQIRFSLDEQAWLDATGLYVSSKKDPMPSRWLTRYGVGVGFRHASLSSPSTNVVRAKARRTVGRSATLTNLR
ncbi:hypothetical protein TNCV_2558221 [Trichonephila clavipes]|nr:hypothetical protein TNCV_2558221 [Trichonephila clavipes]